MTRFGLGSGVGAALTIALACGGMEGGGSETGFWECSDDADCPRENRCVERICVGEGADAGAGRSAGASGGDAPSGGAGAAPRGGSTGVGGAFAGGAGSTSSGAGGGSGGAITGGTTGGTATGGSASGCNAPNPEPVANPTALQNEVAELSYAFCVTLERDGCLARSFASRFSLSLVDQAIASGCSADDVIQACAYEQMFAYEANVSPECHDAWRDGMLCAAAASYDETTCSIAELGKRSTGVTDPCQAAEDAFLECGRTYPAWPSVTGSHTTCTYGIAETSPCTVLCEGDNTFALDCSGPEGLPLRCSCTVNGNSIGASNFATWETYYASSCEDAAQRAADGMCTDRLDCCFAYNDGVDRCLCGSDLESLGVGTCEEAAAVAGGQVVDICPQYEANFAVEEWCWPPPCD